MAAKHFLSLEISEECGYCYTVSYFLSVCLFTPFHGQSNSNLQALRGRISTDRCGVFSLIFAVISSLVISG